jgi:hypothetical protein
LIAPLLGEFHGIGSDRRRAAAGIVDDAEDVRFLHDQQLFTVERDLGARPLAEQDAVAGLDVHGDAIAVVVLGACAHGDHFTFGGLFLGAVGDDQTTLGLLVGFDAADQHTVMQRSECHFSNSPRKVRLSPN